MSTVEVSTSIEFAEREEEIITAEKVLINLQNAWINEKFAPEILPHQTEILNLMMEQVFHIEENTCKIDKNNLRSITHRMEIERIRYLITSYIRNRLKKIERFTKYILDTEISRDASEKFLWEGENKFASDFMQYSEKCLKRIALQYIPTLVNNQSDEGFHKPNLMSHVILKAINSVAGVAVGIDDDVFDLNINSQHIAPYHLISKLLLEGSVQLM